MGRILLSICALVVAVGLAGAQSQENSPRGETRPAQGDNRASDNVQIATDLGRIARALESQDTPQDSAREKQDLQAQLAMAHWAKWVFWAAFFQAILSGVGVLLIYITFRETRRAGDAAESMAAEAVKANDAAQAVSKIAREQLIAERRPWMAPMAVEIAPPISSDYEFAFRLVFQNTGNSPALDVTLFTEVDIDDFMNRETGFKNFLRRRRAGHEGGKVIFPGGDFETTINHQLSRSAVAKRANRFIGGKPPSEGLSPMLFYALLYRSNFTDGKGRRSVHHTGGMFHIMRSKGEIVVGSMIPIDDLRLVPRDLDGASQAT